jgi:hypothetical protein
MYETGGAFPTPGPSAWASGPTTNLGATYQAWGQDFPTYGGAFITKCNANSLTPFVELEPWESGPGWNTTVLFSDITNGTWDSWLTGIGTFIAGTGKPVILTFGHEMNVSGQYPWSQGDTGSGPGGGALPASQWITTWNYVRNKVNSTANGYALWMWACSAWTGGTTVDPSPWWPGASNVDMVGIDGYPNTQYGASLGTFTGQLGPTVTAIRNHGWTAPIYIAETNLAQMVASGGESITSFVADMHAAGISGILEFEDAAWNLPQMSGAQWNEYNAAVATLTASSGTASTATAFSPAAGDLVLVMVSWMFASPGPVATLSCQDSDGNSYTSAVQLENSYDAVISAIFTYEYPSAPGPVTLHVTCSSTAAADCLVSPRVISGQAAAPVGATVTTDPSGSETAITASITTTTAGSLVYIAGGATSGCTLTPASGTAAIASFAGNQEAANAVTSLPTGTPGPVTVGWTASPASPFGYGIAAAEILPGSSSGSGGGGLLMVSVA